jgi:hypothetical protein
MRLVKRLNDEVRTLLVKVGDMGPWKTAERSTPPYATTPLRRCRPARTFREASASGDPRRVD